MPPEVYCIILCYNGIQLTLDCLQSLYCQDYDNLQVMVVDNGSQDHTTEIIKHKFPQTVILENGENLGYAEGNNTGIKFAVQRGADFIFLVNNDTWVSKECISSLVDVFQATPGVGAAGPMVYAGEGDKIISSAGGAIEWGKAGAINVGMGEQDTGQYKHRYVDFINGCGILVSKDVVKNAGMLDPLYFMYWEETDWCMRIKKKGYSIIFEPASLMIHKAPIESVDLGPTTLYYLTRNRFLFFMRHATGAYKPISVMKAFHGAIRGVIQSRSQGKYAHSRAMGLAILHAVKGKWGYTDPCAWLSEG